MRGLPPGGAAACRGRSAVAGNGEAVAGPDGVDELRVVRAGFDLPAQAGRVSLAPRPAGATARLTVTDTGPGIPPGELPHIFERLWRGSAATTRAGAGIGLAVAAELAAAHGGAITAGSGPGGGAAFTLTLPALS